MPSAPAEELFPKYPATWYLFGLSRELRRQPLSKPMLGRRLVAFRSSNSLVSILDGDCAHMSADLGRGTIVDNCLQCPFHHWKFDATGACVSIPTQSKIPPWAKQRTYPVVERHGLLYFFAAEQPLFSLPFFEGCDERVFVRGRPFRFVADMPWHVLVGNAFDDQHFASVHDRQLVAPATVDEPSPFARRIRYRAHITGKSIFDRLLRRTVGDLVDISITSYGGPHILVQGDFQRVTSYIVITPRPTSANQVIVDVTVLAQRGRVPLLRACTDWLKLEIRRIFTRGFLQDDISRLPGVRYNRHRFVESDRRLIEYYAWAAQLPEENSVPRILADAPGKESDPFFPHQRSHLQGNPQVH